MFTEKFPFNQRIRQISITPNKINLYLSTSYFHDFIQDYPNIPFNVNSGDGTCFDCNDFCIKDLNLRNEIQKINLGMMPEHLKYFLDFISDSDLTSRQKKVIVEEYGAYFLDQFLTNFHYLAASFRKLLHVIRNCDSTRDQQMPFFSELCIQTNTQLAAEDRKQEISCKYLSIYDTWIHREHAKKLLYSFVDCCLFVSELDQQISALEQLENFNWHNLIKEIDDSLLLADHITFPNLENLPLLLNEEIRTLFSDIHEDLFDWLVQLVKRAEERTMPCNITIKNYHSPEPPTYN